MVTDIFIKSYRKDFPWLKNCLRSITERCRGFRKTILVVPNQDLDELKTWGLTQETVIGVDEPSGRGYDIQQCIKLEADKYSDADYITFFDSDLYATKELRPEMLFSNNKPIIYITALSSLNGEDRKIDAVPWRPVMEHVMKQKIQYEYMRRHPMTYPVWILKSFRDYVQREFKFNIWEYFVGGKCPHPLSEFNVIGAFAWVFYKNRFVFVNTEKGIMPEPFVVQFWSHGGPGHPFNAPLLLKYGLTIT